MIINIKIIDYIRTSWNIMWQLKNMATEWLVVVKMKWNWKKIPLVRLEMRSNALPFLYAAVNGRQTPEVEVNATKLIRFYVYVLLSWRCECWNNSNGIRFNCFSACVTDVCLVYAKSATVYMLSGDGVKVTGVCEYHPCMQIGVSNMKLW